MKAEKRARAAHKSTLKDEFIHQIWEKTRRIPYPRGSSRVLFHP